MRKVKELLHHNSAANTANASSFNNTGLMNSGLGSGNTFTNTNALNSGSLASNSIAHPMMGQSWLPASVSSWQQGQTIPQGWRLGRKGYLKPSFVLPTQYQSWQQGQAIPEGYRLSKRGSLRPVNIWSWYQTTYVSAPTVAPVSQVFTTAPVIEHREKAAVIQEVIRPGLREEIQPVIHREREQLEIREELLPIYEKQVRPTIVEERQLAAEIKAEVRLGAAPIIAPGPQSSVFVEAEHREAVMHAPIIEETIHKKIIEEVQPVIHRETIAPRVIHERKDIYEKIIEAPVVTYATLPARYEQAAVIAAPAAMDVTTVTTTIQETEFIPQNSGLLQKGVQNLNLGNQTTTPAPFTRQ